MAEGFMDRRRSKPYGAHSISLGLHPPALSTAAEQISAVIEQARTAERAGFDGATLSEHHVGFEGYLPQPLTASDWILQETTQIWSGPTPTLLTLRNPRLLAEDIAWTAARHPGRLGVAVAAGYTESDFTALGLTTESLGSRFATAFDDLASALQPDGPLAGDRAIADGVGQLVPILSAANSRKAARAAATRGTGVLLIGSDDSTRAEDAVAAYEEAGGFGPRVWIRRVYVGAVPDAALEELERSFDAAGGSRSGPMHDFVSGAPDDIVETLTNEAATLGKNASLNLRVHLPGQGPEATYEQIEALGTEVLPALRRALAV